MNKPNRARLDALITQTMVNLGAIQTGKTEWTITAPAGEIFCSWRPLTDHNSSPFFHCRLNWTTDTLQHYHLPHKWNLYGNSDQTPESFIEQLTAHIKRVWNVEEYVKPPRIPLPLHPCQQIRAIPIRDLFDSNPIVAKTFLTTGIMCSYSFIFRPSDTAEKLRVYAERLAKGTPEGKHRMLDYFSFSGYRTSQLPVDMSKPKTFGEFDEPVYELTALDGEHCGLVNAKYIETAEKYCGPLNWHVAGDRLFGFTKTGEPSNETLKAVAALCREDI